MEPKLKAKELIEKMNVIHYVKLGGKNTNSKGLPVSMHDDQIKQCALIAVDEIIESHYKLLSGVKTSIYKYWQEVKQEIEKL
jgi:hypothetical protein